MIDRTTVGILIALMLSAPSASAEDSEEPPEGIACGAFVEIPDGVPPTGMIAMGMFGREVAAAGLCAQKKDTANACEHYRRALKALEGLDAALASQLRIEVSGLQQQLACT